jgi:hypothetical protein
MRKLLVIVGFVALLPRLMPAQETAVFTSWAESIEARVEQSRALAHFMEKSAARLPADEKVEEVRKRLLTAATLCLEQARKDARLESVLIERAVNETVTAAPTPAVPPSVFTLLIYRNERVYSSSAVSKERAFQALVTYVKGQWSKRFPQTAIPATEEEAVHQYFDLVRDPENYEIIEHELLK